MTDLQKVASANSVQRKSESRFRFFFRLVPTLVSATVRIITGIFIKKGKAYFDADGGGMEFEKEKRYPDGTVEICRVKIKGSRASANGSLEI